MRWVRFARHCGVVGDTKNTSKAPQGEQQGLHFLGPLFGGEPLLFEGGPLLFGGGPLLFAGGPLLFGGGPLLFGGGPLLFAGGPLLFGGEACVPGQFLMV